MGEVQGGQRWGQFSAHGHPMSLRKVLPIKHKNVVFKNKEEQFLNNHQRWKVGHVRETREDPVHHLPGILVGDVCVEGSHVKGDEERRGW